MSAAERARTSSKSREELTSSPISASVARTSAEISGLPSWVAACEVVPVGFIRKDNYRRPRLRAGRDSLPGCPTLGTESLVRLFDELHTAACPYARRTGLHHL